LAVKWAPDEPADRRQQILVAGSAGKGAVRPWQWAPNEAVGRANNGLSELVCEVWASTHKLRKSGPAND
jgi:hypothetical protein